MYISDHSDHYIIALASFVTGGGLLRFGVYVSQSLPPLGPKAGWWAQLGYNMLKGLSGVDPNSTTLSTTTMRNLPSQTSKQVAQAAADEKQP